MAAKKPAADGVRLTHPNGTAVVVAKEKQAQLEEMGFTVAQTAKKSTSTESK